MQDGPPRIDRRLLRGWKAIAAFLEVDVRTVQRWHKRTGIPILRQPGDLKSHPVAYADDLELWLRKGGAEAGPESLPTVEAAPDSAVPSLQAPGVEVTQARLAAVGPPRRSRRLVASISVGLLVIVAAAALWWFRDPPIPHVAVTAVETLIVRDVSGRTLWTRALPGIGHSAEWAVAGVRLDDVVVMDVDGDGRPEVLANVPPKRSGNGTGTLICFEGNGRERWRFTHGRELRWREREFNATFAGRLLRPIVAGGRRYLLSAAWHSHWFPAQVALLDVRTGRLEDEYWHPGAVYAALQLDTDADGVGEVLLGGVSNPGVGLGRGIVTILKVPFSSAPRQAVSGMSNFTGAREVQVAMLPRPDACTVMGQVPIAAELTPLTAGRVLVRTNCQEVAVFHTLDRFLNVVDTRVSDNYGAVHLAFERRGLIGHAFSQAELACLGRSLRLPTSPDGNEPSWARYWQGCE